eukprot:5214281-Amphidinium_carterae.1
MTALSPSSPSGRFLDYHLPSTRDNGVSVSFGRAPPCRTTMDRSSWQLSLNFWRTPGYCCWMP